MPTITPSSINRVYKKNLPQNIPTDFITYSHAEVDLPKLDLSIRSLPNWLKVLNLYHDTTARTITFSITINSTYVSAMANGDYEATLMISGQLGFQTYSFKPYLPYTLRIEDGEILTISPSDMSFTYTIGDPFPQPKIMQLKSEFNWNITPIGASWLLPTPLNGLGNSPINIGVDPTGLSTGNYEGIVFVKDTNFEREMKVTLTVKGQDNETNFLYVTPENAEFISELNIENTTLKSINIDVSHDWTAVASQTWLVLSNNSGVAGNQNINLSVNSEALAVGDYTAQVTFTSNSILKTIYIQLKVIEFVSEGIKSETLYFAKDRNKLMSTSFLSNSYLQLILNVATGTSNISYTQEAAYHKGLANVVIGEETEQLLNSFIPTDNLITHIRNNVYPVNFGITSNNINKITNSVTPLNNYQNVWFLKGTTPKTPNKISYIPNHVTVTNKAVLAITVLADDSPLRIQITGDVTATVNSQTENNRFTYTAYINLAEFDLIPGNMINISYAGLSLDVTIKPNEAEENLIAFENEWGEYEFFNTSGFLTKTPTAKKTITELAKEGKKHNKIVNIDAGVNYTLNTGNIYSQEEVDWLGKIIDAKHVYFYEGNNRIEVILTTNKLTLYKTRQHLKQYTLNFKRAII